LELDTRAGIRSSQRSRKALVRRKIASSLAFAVSSAFEVGDLLVGLD
jgi:hypothetical protein